MTQIVSVAFSDDAETRLNALIVKTEATGAAEVIRNALRLYEALIEAQEAGNRWLVKTPNGNIQQWRPFGSQQR